MTILCYATFVITNPEIAKLLRHIAASFAIKDERKYHFQIVAYERAADTIQNLSTQIADLYKEDKLHDLPGIGTSIQQHLTDLFKHGKVEHFETVMKGIPPAVFPLLDVPSFGPKKAYKLVTAFNLDNPQTVLEDIKKLATEGKIAGLDGFGEKSQADVLRALGEFAEGAGKTTRMLLPFAAEIADSIVSYMKQNPAVIEIAPLGSLRRRAPTVGDVDLAVATKDPESVLSHFVNYPYTSRVIEKGPATSSILTTGGQQIDLMIQPLESWGSLLQHFTGSKHHNVHLRDLALKKGLSLSEYGIKILKSGDDTRKHYRTEESFYEAIGLQWIPPEMREDTGEIELAQEHKLPKLVELKDIKGDFHIHSSYPIEPSHDLGMNSMQDMLDMAKEQGYEYLAFSEHNPSVSRHSKTEIYEILAKRQEKIEQLKESNKDIRIISLLETDILANGNLAIDEKCLNLLDGTIVSIHSAFGMNTEDMTKRVLGGLSHPKAKILAHPTGRKIGERNGYQLDWDKVFAFCKENNKALEINCWPERSDLPDSLIKQAVSHNIKLAIDTDSHAVSHMQYMYYGVWMARRGWATKEDILNTMEYNKLMDWLRS